MPKYNIELGNYTITFDQDITDANLNIFSQNIKALTLEKVTLADETQQIGLILGNNNGLENQLTSINALLELKSTTGALLLSRMSTIERDNLALPVEGMILFNIDTQQFEFYQDNAWINFGFGTVISTPSTENVQNYLAMFSNNSADAITNSAATIKNDVLEVPNIVTDLFTLTPMTTVERNNIALPKSGTIAFIQEGGNEHLDIYLNNKWSIISTI